VSEATPEQRRAISLRDRDVFLEAGAGTGKTTVLVERYCDAVTEDEIGIDGVLAFTFTDRAAAQLRGRVRAELERRDLTELARDVDRAWISTIHAFCRRLLAAHSVAAGLDPRFRVLDDGATERIADRAFDLALEELLAGGDPGRLELVAAFGTDGLRTLVRSAHDELRSRGRAHPRLPEIGPPEPGSGVAELGAAARLALEATREARNGSPRREALASAVAVADQAAGGSAPTIAQLDALLVKAGKGGFNLPEVEDYCAALRIARRRAVERESIGSYEALRELVELFAVRYAEAKEEASALDFEDLQLQTVELLHEHEPIRERYRERFRHLMVDEFQDTNRLQLELIGELSGTETRLFTVGDEFQSIYGFRHADVSLFRAERDRADAAPSREAEVLPLLGNFRARPELIAATNAVGAALLDGFQPLTVGRSPGPPAAGEGPAVELLLTERDGWEPTRRNAQGELEETGVDIDRTEGDPAQPYRVAEARFLAARLRHLHEQDEVHLGDIVVLLRAFTHAGAYEEALERAGLRPYVVGGGGYWQGQQVEDLRDLLAVIANPLDDQALFGALASPACGAAPDTLWLLRRSAGDGPVWPALERHFGEGPTGEPDPAAEAIERAEAEGLRRFHATITALREDQPALPIDELVDRAATALGYDLAVLMRPRGRRRMANVRKLMRLAREYEATEGRDLRGFVEWVREGSGREPQAATEAERHDGVRVMTVHAAKGLEFPVVAVADLGRKLTAGGPRPAIRIGDPPDRGGADAVRVGVMLARIHRKGTPLFDYDDLAEEAEREDAAEACRLAYVAATRAARHLLLSGCFDPGRARRGEGEPPLNTPVVDRLLVALGDLPADDGELEIAAPDPRPGLSEGFEPARIAVRMNRPSPEAAAALTHRHQRERPGVSGATPGARPPILPATDEAAAIRHLSYSALSDYGRCAYRFGVERVIGLGKRRDPVGGDDGERDEAGDSRSRGFAFGSAIHSLLEWSARNRWTVPSTQLCRRHLRREGMDASEAEVARALHMCAAWIDSELRGRIAGRDSALRPETPFLLEIGGVIVRGKIDLLASRDGERFVVDYKTNHLAGADPETAMAPYRLQEAIYAVAAAEGLAAEDGDPAPAVHTAYVFLEAPDRAVTREYGAPELRRARKELEALVERIRSGRFEVTDEPHRALCFDCPARAHLCSWEPEMTMRERP
jgi:ATP-dependent helicase/nuclease subunit A